MWAYTQLHCVGGIEKTFNAHTHTPTMCIKMYIHVHECVLYSHAFSHNKIIM